MSANQTERTGQQRFVHRAPFVDLHLLAEEALDQPRWQPPAQVKLHRHRVPRALRAGLQYGRHKHLLPDVTRGGRCNHTQIRKGPVSSTRRIACELTVALAADIHQTVAY